MRALRLFAVAALSIAAVSAATAREMRIGLITPPAHVWTQAANRVAERLPAATNGQLTLKVFPAGQLGIEPDMFQQMSSGLLDMGLMTVGISSLRAPALNGWFSPYLFPDVAAASKAAETPAAKKMLEQLDRAGLIGMGYTFAGMRHVLMRDAPVSKAEDLKARKIRIVPFPAMRVWWEAAGATPTPVQLTEVYQSLQNGVLDGVDIDLDAMVGSNFQNVAKHLTLTNHMPWPAVFIVTKKAWGEMTEAQRKGFTEVVNEALAWATEQQIKAETANLEKVKGQLSITAINDGDKAFAAANAAFQNQYGKDPLVAEFQAQAKAAIGR